MAEHLTAEEVKAAARWTEAEFLKAVLEMARLFGWRSYHASIGRAQSGRWLTPSQGDGRGWPDLALVRNGRIIFAELKVGKNKTTPDQDRWLADIKGCGLPAFVWRPEMWAEIESTLRGQ